MKLTNKAKNLIKKNTRLKNRLALALDCSGFTIERWLKDNSDNLTKAIALEIIAEELELPMDEVLDRMAA